MAEHVSRRLMPKVVLGLWFNCRATAVQAYLRRAGERPTFAEGDPARRRGMLLLA